MVPSVARITGLAAALSLLAATPASAAFAPDLSLSLDTPTASSQPALTATYTQPAVETPVQRFTLNLGAGFDLAGAPAAQACPDEALQTSSCPASSVIGAVEAQIGPTARFSGAIHKLAANRFAASVIGLGGSVRQEIAGSVAKRSDGSVDLRLDRLPALPLTSLSFRFEGDGLSLIRTPSGCGTYAIDGKFTSRARELALDRTSIAITGCSGVPAVQVQNVRLNHRSFRVGGYRTIIAWWAAQGVDHTNVRIERRVRGHWRVLDVLVGPGNAGENRLRWDGRLNGRALRRGGYGVRIQPAGSAPSKITRFRIR